MREMKDSGIAWIGVIPQDWKIVRTKSLYCSAKEIAGVRADNFERLALTLNGVIKRSKEDSVGLQPEKFSGYQILKKGELVFKLIDLENVATSRVGLSPYTGIVSPAYIVLSKQSRAKDLVVRYSMYHFLSMWQREIFNQMGDNGVRSSLNAKELLNIPHPFPSIYEQKRIVTFLDAQCAEIDAVLEKTRASIEEYKKLKQAVITQAVTKGIRGDRPMKDSGIEWIGDIPKEFETLQLKFLCKLITDGTHFSPSTVETGLPYITAGDVHGIGLDYNSAKRISEEDFNLLVNQGCQPLKGDVLLVKDGATTGRVGFVDSDVPCVILSSVAMLRPADNINGHYLMYLLSSYFLQNQILVSMAGSAMPRITLTKLVKYIGLLSPLSEQQEIADYLDEKCADIDALVAKKQQYLTEIENYKKSLIYEYVTGKKEVHPL